MCRGFDQSSNLQIFKSSNFQIFKSFYMLLLSGPNISGNEWKYVKDCLDTGWVSSVGSYVDQFEKMTAEFAGTKFAVATSSGTTA